MTFIPRLATSFAILLITDCGESEFEIVATASPSFSDKFDFARL